MFGGWGGQPERVALTLYTDAYVVRGSIETRQHRLSDILNLAEDDFLVVASDTAHGPVLFAVADHAVDALPELRSPKVSETALISIPPFKVTGRIHLLPERALREALLELTGRFIPVTDATYWSDTAGAAKQSAPMVAINHARAQILSPFGDESP